MMIVLAVGILILAGGQLYQELLPDRPALASVQTLAAGATAQAMGEYVGSVQLVATYTGALSDTQAITRPAALGSVDLALVLTRTGNVVTGMIVPDKTLIFPAEGGLGPRVEGALDGRQMVLTSAPFTTPLTAERTVTRQFQLMTTQAQGPTLEGTYRETVTGLGPEPATAVGTFRLQRPLRPDELLTSRPVDTPAPTPTREGGKPQPRAPHTAYLPAVEAGRQTAATAGGATLEATPVPRVAAPYSLYLPKTVR
jgi:hypothetical protein